MNTDIAALKFGDQIVARSWQVVTPTIGLVALMVTIPKELLYLSNTQTPMIIAVILVNERYETKDSSLLGYRF